MNFDDWWKYSCVRFIITPSAPKKGETSFNKDGDYLEIAFGLTSENVPLRHIYNKPKNTTLDSREWDAVIVRNNDEKTTVYEVRLPWTALGIEKFNTDYEIGLAYAVSAQDYDVKKGIIEWQNAILTEKDVDSAAVISFGYDGCTPPVTPSEPESSDPVSDITEEMSEDKESSSALSELSSENSTDISEKGESSDNESNAPPTEDENGSQIWISIGAVVLIAAIIIIKKKK